MKSVNFQTSHHMLHIKSPTKHIFIYMPHLKYRISNIPFQKSHFTYILCVTFTNWNVLFKTHMSCVACYISNFIFYMSYIKKITFVCHISPTCLISHISLRLSQFQFHISYITCQMSYLKGHISNIIFHMSNLPFHFAQVLFKMLNLAF